MSGYSSASNEEEEEGETERLSGGGLGRWRGKMGRTGEGLRGRRWRKTMVRARQQRERGRLESRKMGQGVRETFVGLLQR